MQHPAEDDLITLALGEAAVDPDVVSHVGGCPQCTRALDQWREVLGHARDARSVTLVEPPASLWDEIASAIAEPQSAADPSPRRRALVRGGWALAAGLSLVAGIGIGRLLAPAVSTPPTPAVVASTALDTLDTRQQRGTAEVLDAGGTLSLAVKAPLDGPQEGYLEVWLINTDLKRMVSVGVLRPGASDQEFSVTKDLLDAGYRVVDISRESFDDRPQHSGDSLVRGTLTW